MQARPQAKATHQSQDRGSLNPGPELISHALQPQNLLVSVHLGKVFGFSRQTG